MSTKSMQLAGFTLAFLALVFGFFQDNPNRVMWPSILLLSAFIFLLGISQFTWAAMKQWQFYAAEICHNVATVLIVIAGLWIFYIVFDALREMLEFLGIVYIIYAVLNLFLLFGDIQSLWKNKN